MSLQITGKCQVYHIEEKSNMVTASLRTSKKNTQGEWESEFFNAKFVGMAGAAAKGLMDKDKIEVKKAVLENRKWKDKQYISVVVFEYEKEGGQQGNQGDAYESVEDDDTLPF